MGKRIKYWILAFAIAGFTFAVYSQTPQEGPPEPNMTQETVEPICGSGDGGGGPGIPPPVGLCLPINNYLLPLLISGVALGAFSLVWLEKKQALRNGDL